MSDIVLFLSMIGALPYIIGTIVAFGAIALYFGFVKKT